MVYRLQSLLQSLKVCPVLGYVCVVWQFPEEKYLDKKCCGKCKFNQNVSTYLQISWLLPRVLKNNTLIFNYIFVLGVPCGAASPYRDLCLTHSLSHTKLGLICLSCCCSAANITNSLNFAHFSSQLLSYLYL